MNNTKNIKMKAEDSFEELFQIFQESNKTRNLSPDTIKDYSQYKNSIK